MEDRFSWAYLKEYRVDTAIDEYQDTEDDLPDVGTAELY